MVRKFPLSSCRKQLFSLLILLASFNFVIAQNPIITENAIAGTPAAQWDITGSGDPNIQGFATDMSVNKGTTVSFKINVNGGGTYSINIYRIGYYQGNGARLVANLGSAFAGVAQPPANTNTTTGLVDCSTWGVSASWPVPATAVSGVYIAKLTRSSGSSHIIFVVRDDASTSPMLFKTSDATWQAYNAYGGNSLYVGATSFPGGHAAKVSYNRPFITRDGGGGGGAMEDWVFNAEYPMIRFLERNGYNVRYTTDVDMERSASAITTANCKIFLSVGHDEYWSAGERTRIENARNAGVHLAFFSGNEVYWKTRWEDNNRTLVCYKEGTLGENVCGGKCDPTSTWTGLWRAGAGYDANKPENGLTGQISWDGTPGTILVPADYKNLRFWRNTSVASLGTGQTASLTTGTLGYEWDYEQYEDSYPAGRITLSSTTLNGKTHKLSLYRHSSGALVFGAGTIQWTWGLDNVHDRGNAAVSLAMQQATVNLFADMGVQAGALMSGLQAATASTDLTAPTCTITAPVNGASIPVNNSVTITGTAAETGGGQLVGVEVSLDGGLTWKAAVGTTNWSYLWTPSATGTANIRVRGFDDSGNIGVPGAAGSSSNITVNVTGTAVSATSIFQPTDVPSYLTGNDGTAIEVGMKFRSTQAGTITGIRYYKSTSFTGTRTGHLWSSTGVKLAEVVFSGETASGWQQMSFPSPVAITANTTYVIAYFSSSGSYVSSDPYFTTAVVNNPLRALADGEDGPNGLYLYTTTSAFPTATFNASNYFVDVVFAANTAPDVTAPTVTIVAPANNATNVARNTTITGTFSEAINPATVTSTTVELRNAANTLITATLNVAQNVVTITPSAILAASTVYNVRLKGTATGIKDLAGNALAADYTWSFTTAAATDVTPPTVSSVVPANNATNVAVSAAITATFSEAISAATVNTSTVELRNAANVLIAATLSVASNVVTITPSAALSSSTVYNVRLKGTATGIKDLAGNALAADYTWSFTTAVAADVTPPTVASVTPVSGATAVAITTAITATFSEAMNASTITAANVELRNAANTLIATTLSLASNVLTITPSAALANSTVYTVTIKGTATGVKDLAGNALVANYTWSFTTAAAVTCPCTIFQPSNIPTYLTGNDGTPIEVGMKFRSTQAGFITGVRYYKSTSFTSGTRTGHLWSSTGTKLAEVAFSGETASGWQQMTFPSPVAISANTTYVISYFSSTGNYVSTDPYFTTAVVNGTLRALADGEDGPNGLYQYTSVFALPTASWNSSNYFVDVVFNPSTGPDVTPPTVISSTPGNGATTVANSTTVLVNFSEPMTQATLTATNVELRNAANALVAATLTVSSTQATLTPSAPLAYSGVYTARIKGGTTGVKDVAGNALAADYTFTFTVADPPPPSPLDGKGGPILVVSSTTNSFSRYPVEILRAEGLNGFAASDIAAVNATLLNSYDVVVLGEMALTAAQATVFTNWVNAGGTLIAFRPSTQLSSLLGITKIAGSLSNQYILVNTASGPGSGIVGQTMQFHGTADLYTLSGATSLATLYSNATTATVNPAVTTRTVGSNGGRAIAFTYDLARSVVYTRQGNPAWAGQKRDGTAGPIRSDDLFFGQGSDPHWIDFNKIAIPQADEQQRLLTNIILQSNLHRKPLPRFWFLPKGYKAAVVMTGDDHNNNGTTPRFNQYLTQGPNTAQDVADWKAVRATSYLWLNTPVSNAQVAAFESQGFEIALHLNTGAAGCENYTPASYESDLTAELNQFTALFPSLSPSVSNRTHCIVWSDWATQPKIQAQKGIRLDANYYYWPPTWVSNRPGMFTGSGMPMRFADTDGALIDCYQMATQIVDESQINYSTFTASLFDKAVGPEGYYGVFAAQMHTDTVNHAGSDITVANAQARGIPVVSAKQMLTWLDGRNNSSFGTMTWTNNTLSFPVTALAGAYNLKGMVPLLADNGNQLTSMTRNGSGIAFTVETIKGMQYAFFDVPVGTSNFTASYNPDLTAPVITNVVATPNADGTATITWDTDEASDSKVDYGTTAASLNLNANAAALVTAHTITLTGLAPGVTYHFRVTSKDLANNTVTSPATTNAPLTFTIPAGACFVDQLVTDFSQGSSSNTLVVAEADGGVILNPASNEDFAGTTLPAAFTSEVFSAGGTTVVQNGTVTVNGTHIYSNSSFAPGTSVEFTATFNTGNFQSVGFANDQAFSGTSFFIIGQSFADGNLYARGSDGSNISLGTNLLGTQHRYLIKWNANNFEFYVDGSATPAATIAAVVSTNMFLQVSDFPAGDGTISVDWLRIQPYATSGVFTSRIFDAGADKNWSAVNWNTDLPAGSSVGIAVRTGNTPAPDGTWSAFTPLTSSGASVGTTTRYIQYQASLATTDTKFTPVLKDISFTCGVVSTAPVVTGNPSSQTICAGTPINLTSAATGAPTPTVQWQESTNGGTSWVNTAGATNATLALTPVAGDNNKRYRAVWTNIGGSVNSNVAILTVNATPGAPTVAVVNNCGTSVLTAGAVTGTLLWSNGATTNSITVNTAAVYTVTQTANGCTSPAGTGTAAPKPTPALSSGLTKAVTSGTSVAYTATSTVTGTTFSWTRAAVTGISNTAASGTGNITESLINTTASPVNVTYVYTLTANGCSSVQNLVVTVSNPPVVCALTSSLASTFNSTAIPAPRYIWFNGVFDPSTLGSTGVVNFYMTNATITFTANSQNYTLNIPNSHIRFATTVSSATTTFTNNVWETQAPLSASGNIFLGGLSYQVPANLPGNISNVTWTANVSSDRAGVSIVWKWAAAVYSNFAANAGLTVKAMDGILSTPYFNTDNAGAPQNFKSSLVAGAKGTGGSNYTGTYSGTATVACTAIVGQRSSEPVVTINPQDIVQDKAGTAKEEVFAAKLEVLAMPNPSSSYFNLVIKGTKDGPVTVRIVDVMGRVLERHEKIAPNSTLRLGDGWKGGTYFAEVIQGDQRKMVKIIKTN